MTEQELKEQREIIYSDGYIKIAFKYIQSEDGSENFIANYKNKKLFKSSNFDYFNKHARKFISAFELERVN